MTMAQGGCLCGTLRYEVAAAPSRVTMCHCKFCQCATGGAYLVEPIFSAPDFAMIKGTAKTYIHISEGSGQNVYIHFCDTCGTKLYLTFDRFKDVVGVYGGTFDDPDWFDRTPENSKHIFLGVAQRGTVIPAGVPTFLAHATDGHGTPIAPKLYDTPWTIGTD